MLRLDTLPDDLNRMADLWAETLPNLQLLIDKTGNQRLNAKLVRFTADMDEIVQLPQQLTRRDQSENSQEEESKSVIIVVDDEPDILMILFRVLREITGGWDIIPCTNAADAIVAISTRPVDLLITSDGLRNISGMQLLKETRRLSPHTSLICTATNQKVELQARRNGASHFLVKPFPIDRFVDAVKATLSLHIGRV